MLYATNSSLRLRSYKSTPAESGIRCVSSGEQKGWRKQMDRAIMDALSSVAMGAASMVQVCIIAVGLGKNTIRLLDNTVGHSTRSQ